MHSAQLKPPSYEQCTLPSTPILTLDIKDTRIYNPSNSSKKISYRTTSNLNREFVRGGFGLFRVNPYKTCERDEVYDIRAVGDARFRIAGLEPGFGRVVSCERKFGFSGHWWEVRQVHLGQVSRRGVDDKRGEVVMTAKRTSRDDGTLRWCDGRGRLIATDTKLVRRRGNHENQFQMPVLEMVGEVEREVRDLLVACWLARVWVEVVNAKKKTLLDGV